MSRIWAVGLVAMIAVGSSVSAEETASQSNASPLVLGVELASLIAVEHAAVGAIGGTELERLEPRAETGRRVHSDEIQYDAAWLASLPAATGGPEWQCLAEALYFEARGETIAGQFAVAEVILNRRDVSQFPATVCGVVNQGTGRLHACQFSYTCDGRAERVSEPAAYARAGKIARLMLDGGPRTLTGDATYFHTTGVRPSWSRRFTRTTRIGQHIFYRPPLQISAN